MLFLTEDRLLAILPNKPEWSDGGISMKCSCGMNPSGWRIIVGGSPVGIAGLEEVFQGWQAGGKKAQDLTKDQIIQAIREYNYIIPRLEDEYAEAVIAQYAVYSEKPPQE